MCNTHNKRNFFLYKILFAVVIAFVLTTCCFGSDITQQIMEYSGVDKLNQYLPDIVRQQSQLSDISPDNNHLEEIIDRFLGFIAEGFKKEIKGFSGICVFIILCAVVRLNGDFLGSSQTVDYICMLCMSGCCYTFTATTLDFVLSAIQQIDVFMTAMLPVMSALYTVSGNVATAVTQNAGIFAAMTLFERINASLLTALFNFCFALTLVCAISSVKLSGIVKFLKNTVIKICVTLLTLLVSILFFQSSFSSATDSLAMRGAKYAVSFVPIIGALLGEATRTVAAGISVIKASAGIFGVVAVLYTAMIPAATLICKKILLWLCTVFAQIIGAEKEAVLLEEVNSILSILLSIILSVGLFFILALTIFIKTGVNV